MTDRVRVKICGVTRPADAALAAELGADLIGVNLWPGSSRWIEPARARRVVEAVAGRAITVGIVVNQPPAAVEELRQRAGVELLQLHGDEPDEQVHALGGCAIKVLRRPRPPCSEDFEAFPNAWGFLVDRWHPTTFGGSGAAWVYPDLAPFVTRRLLLAGGLLPDTVRSVIERSRPWGVDVCSGVESAPGIKDPQRMQRFFEEAHHAQTPTPA